MQCPVCKVDLLISDRQGIEIDYCPQCRGIWLDRGELDKILERSGQIESRPSRDSYQPRERYDDDDDYRRKRRKSFLEELFD